MKQIVCEWGVLTDSFTVHTLRKDYEKLWSSSLKHGLHGVQLKREKKGKKRRKKQTMKDFERQQQWDK